MVFGHPLEQGVDVGGDAAFNEVGEGRVVKWRECGFNHLFDEEATATFDGDEESP